MSQEIVNEVLSPFQRKLRMVPVSWFLEEVLVVIKGAMFDVSNWLYLEKKSFEKQYRLDDDLDNVGGDSNNEKKDKQRFDTVDSSDVYGFVKL